LNRPEAMNALTDELVDQLVSIIETASVDPAVRCLVITGEGRAFCAGGDVKTMSTDTTASFNEKLERLRRKHRLPKLLRECPKVSIAMVNGPAIGAGFGLALCCDFRIIATDAYFGATFARLGMSTDFGVAWLLPRLAGTSLATRWLLRGERIDASAALQAGLVNQVAESGSLQQDALLFAREFSDGPALAYRMIKRNLLAAEQMSFGESLEMEAINQVAAVESNDHKEAVQAFVEKRSAVFQGN